VIICGYGRCGQNLARMLEGEGIPYMALDLDPDRVRQAAAAGDSVVFGDAARLQALMAAGLARASAVVVTYVEVQGALKVLDHTRAHAPHVPVIVRTRDDHDLEKLQAAGAAEVVPEAIEGSLMLASHALALVGVPMRRVIRLWCRTSAMRATTCCAVISTARRRHRRRDAACPPVHLHPAAGRQVDRQPLGHLALHAHGRAGGQFAPRRWQECAAG
jgi:CPA2 family monovalent cation:H+ antiporter-2